MSLEIDHDRRIGKDCALMHLRAGNTPDGAALQQRGFSPSLAVLVLANLIPVYGVVALGWEVFPLLLLFWTENVIIGVFNVLRMLIAKPDSPGMWVAKVFLIPFFCVHYGMFTFIHGVFVVGFFGGWFRQGAEFPGPHTFVQLIQDLGLDWAVLGLFLSHGFSFAYNYLYRGEFKRVDAHTLMGQPYKRVVVLHLTILVGGYLMMALNSPLTGLLFLTALKTWIDARAHFREHRRLQEKPGSNRADSPTPHRSEAS